MIPKFKNALAWEQAQLLMQPAFIRVVDNVRKELEESNWKGSYEEVTTPLPGYHLCLSHGDSTRRVDLWDLCFQVCFCDYSEQGIEEVTLEREVDIDTSLVDETGNVDWQRLEDKTRGIVKEIFASLPE